MSSLPLVIVNVANRENSVKILDAVLVLGKYFISPDTQKYTRHSSASLTVTNLWSYVQRAEVRNVAGCDSVRSQ